MKVLFSVAKWAVKTFGGGVVGWFASGWVSSHPLIVAGFVSAGTGLVHQGWVWVEAKIAEAKAEFAKVKAAAAKAGL